MANLARPINFHNLPSTINQNYNENYQNPTFEDKLKFSINDILPDSYDFEFTSSKSTTLTCLVISTQTQTHQHNEALICWPYTGQFFIKVFNDCTATNLIGKAVEVMIVNTMKTEYCTVLNLPCLTGKLTNILSHSSSSAIEFLTKNKIQFDSNIKIAGEKRIDSRQNVKEGCPWNYPKFIQLKKSSTSPSAQSRTSNTFYVIYGDYFHYITIDKSNFPALKVGKRVDIVYLNIFPDVDKLMNPCNRSSLRRFTDMAVVVFKSGVLGGEYSGDPSDLDKLCNLPPLDFMDTPAVTPVNTTLNSTLKPLDETVLERFTNITVVDDQNDNDEAEHSDQNDQNLPVTEEEKPSEKIKIPPIEIDTNLQTQENISYQYWSGFWVGVYFDFLAILTNIPKLSVSKFRFFCISQLW